MTLLQFRDDLAAILDILASGRISTAVTMAHRIMKNCVTLRVPLRAEREEGPNWGNLEAVK